MGEAIVLLAISGGALAASLAMRRRQKKLAREEVERKLKALKESVII